MCGRFVQSWEQSGKSRLGQRSLQLTVSLDGWTHVFWGFALIQEKKRTRGTWPETSLLVCPPFPQAPQHPCDGILFVSNSLAAPALHSFVSDSS